MTRYCFYHLLGHLMIGVKIKFDENEINDNSCVYKIFIKVNRNGIISFLVS